MKLLPCANLRLRVQPSRDQSCSYIWVGFSGSRSLAPRDLLPLSAPVLGRVRSLRETDMRKSRFTEEQIIKVLKEHTTGLSAGELCRKYGISDATFYKWRSRYGGMEVSDARKLKALEDENRKLKKLLAETMLDASTLKEMLGKNF